MRAFFLRLNTRASLCTQNLVRLWTYKSLFFVFLLFFRRVFLHWMNCRGKETPSIICDGRNDVREGTRTVYKHYYYLDDILGCYRVAATSLSSISASCVSFSQIFLPPSRFKWFLMITLRSSSNRFHVPPPAPVNRWVVLFSIENHSDDCEFSSCPQLNVIIIYRQIGIHK